MIKSFLASTYFYGYCAGVAATLMEPMPHIVGSETKIIFNIFRTICMGTRYGKWAPSHHRTLGGAGCVLHDRRRVPFFFLRFLNLGA